MHYLIDGHNLIGKLADISLADPHDEVKLVLKLKQWAAAGRKRRVTVFFDGGLPGGRAHNLSAGPVQVVFASSGSSADELLMRKVRQIRNPAEYMLVTSDRQVVAAADLRRLGILSSESFAERLDEVGAARETASPSISPTGDEPQVSEAEVAEWLALFGPVPETKPEPAPPQPAAQAEESPAKKERRRKQPLTTAKRSTRKLSEDEVAEWLALFNDESD